MTSSALSAKLRIVIKGIMKKRHITYHDLAVALEISHSTVKRILTVEDLSLGRVEQIADFFEMDGLELLSLCHHLQVDDDELSDEQELFLSRHGNVARYLWLLLNGLSPEDIADRHDLPSSKTANYLSTLADLQFLKLGERGKIKMSYRWPLSFRFGGPLQRTFTDKIFQIFLDQLIAKVKSFKDQKPESPGFSVKLVQFMLTESSYRELLQASSDLLAKYTNESRTQLATNPTKRLDAVSLMIGIDKFDAIAEAFGPL